MKTHHTSTHDEMVCLFVPTLLPVTRNRRWRFLLDESLLS